VLGVLNAYRVSDDDQQVKRAHRKDGRQQQETLEFRDAVHRKEANPDWISPLKYEKHSNDDKGPGTPENQGWD